MSAGQSRAGSVSTPSAIELEYFCEHLRYEVSMLSKTRLLAEAPLPSDQAEAERVALNAYIESFCIHARALFEFFTEASNEDLQKVAKKPNSSFRAWRFADQYTPLPRTKIAAATYGPPLNQQIAHNIYFGRTVEPSKKIDGRMRRDIAIALHHEVEHFRALLKTGYPTSALPTIDLTSNWIAMVPAYSTSSAVEPLSQGGPTGPTMKRGA